MNDTPTTTQQSDHDNIITLIANVKTLTDEIRLLRDDTKEDIKDLKRDKLDKSEFAGYKTDIETDRREHREDLDSRLAGLSRKVDFATKVIYIGLGAVGIIQFVIPLIVRYYKG